MEFGEIPYRNGKKASLQRHVSRRAFHGKGSLFYLYSEKLVNNSYALDDSLSAPGYAQTLAFFDDSIRNDFVFLRGEIVSKAQFRNGKKR